MIKYLYVDIKLFGSNDDTTTNDNTANNNDDLSAYNDIFGIKDGELEEYAKLVNGEVDEANKAETEIDKTEQKQEEVNTDSQEEQQQNDFTDDDNSSDENKSNDEQKQDDTTSEATDFKALYEKAKAELDALKNNQNNQVQHNSNIPQQNMQFRQGTPINQSNMQGFQITPELAKTINGLIQNKAIKLSGLTKDEIDALEYADDDDTNKMRYEQAKSMARNMVMQDVNNKYLELQNRMQYQQNMSRVIANETQKFVNEIKGTENYQNIMTYATGEGLSKYSPYEQEAIKEAYAKVNAGVGNAGDMMVLRSFWNKSVADFNSNNPGIKTNTATNIKKQINNKNKMPRVTQIQGSGSDKGSIWTIDKIKDALNRGAINEIPLNIQRQIEKGMLL